MGGFKIERIGDTIAIRLSEDELKSLGLSVGDSVRVEADAANARRERVMTIAREEMDYYADALAELAK